MAFEIVAEAGRTVDFTVTLKTASGGYLQLQASDVVRCKIGRGASTPDLDLDSVAATADGSVVTVEELGDGSATHASATVRLAQGDTDDLFGPYEAEVTVVDSSETDPADAIKTCEQGCVHFMRTMNGDVGLT